MFFFLSKVIPLLFYPIGFSCLMLVVAIVLIGLVADQRHPLGDSAE
jgi:hypothetical protein